MRFYTYIITGLIIASAILFSADFSEAQDMVSNPAVLNLDTKKLQKTLIQSGRFYFTSGKYEAAIQQWTTALALEPNNKRIAGYIKAAQAKIKEDQGEEYAITSTMMLPKDMPSVFSLDDCIDIAAKNHIPLQVAAKSIRLAEMRLFEARRNMVGTATIRFEEYSGRVSAREYTGRKQFIEGQQPVFHGGELFYTMKQAEVNLEVVKNDYARIKNDIILQVKKAYYTFLKAKENLEFQKALFEEVARISDMVDKQYEAGVLPKLELLNVASQASQVNFQFISAEGDKAVAELILKQAMNVDPKGKMDIRPRFGIRKISADFEKVLQAAMLNRPEMKINTLMLTYYNYEKNIAKAKGWPKVDLMGNWGLMKEEFASEDRLGPPAGTTALDPDVKLEQQWYAGFKVSMPFWGSTGEYSWTKEQWVPVVSAFQGTEATTTAYKFNILDNLKYYSDRQSSEIDFDRARQELTKVKQDITLEVRENCFNYEKALIQLDTATSKIAFQEKDLELNRLRREMDEVPDSTVVESMIKMAQEKFGYSQARSDYCTAVASLNKAIGIEDYFQADSDVPEFEKDK